MTLDGEECIFVVLRAVLLINIYLSKNRLCCIICSYFLLWSSWMVRFYLRF